MKKSKNIQNFSKTTGQITHWQSFTAIEKHKGDNQQRKTIQSKGAVKTQEQRRPEQKSWLDASKPGKRKGTKSKGLSFEFRVEYVASIIQEWHSEALSVGLWSANSSWFVDNHWRMKWMGRILHNVLKLRGNGRFKNTMLVFYVQANRFGSHSDERRPYLTPSIFNLSTILLVKDNASPAWHRWHTASWKIASSILQVAFIFFLDFAHHFFSFSSQSLHTNGGGCIPGMPSLTVKPQCLNLLS